MNETKTPDLERQDLINLLSEMHVDETLCGCTFHDFDRNHTSFDKVPSLQPQLFELCKDELM